MSQTNNDIFPKEEKEKAKRKKIAEMNAVTAQAILKIILNQLGAKYEQYHFIKYCVLIIPIGNSGIEISLSDSAIIDQRQIIQDKLTKLYDFISGGASVGEVVTYCRDNRIAYLGYEARKYAVIDKTSQRHKDSSFESAFVTEGVTSIGEDAFNYCKLVKSIQLPVGLESIGNAAFEHCESLETIQLPEELESIGKFAFRFCESLKSIEIPAGVKSIGDAAFLGCYGLTSIIVDSNNTVYDSRENCDAIIETATDTLIFGCQNTLIPAEVASIGKETFLTSVMIPDSVTSIGDFSFYNCYRLTSVTIGSGVTSIGESAFKYCFGLTSVVIPANVTSIGEAAFYECTSLENITFSGTREQWEKIEKGTNCYYKIPAKVVHCTNGDVEI